MIAPVPQTTTRTTCAYCGVGCGVVATPHEDGSVAIAGDPDHPANFGRLCSKGSALGETLGLEGRLLHPMIRCSSGKLEQVAWDDALDHVANRLQHILVRDGRDAVAFYLSGQLLTEDYYVANKLMKGFLGSANVDTNSRLCMASSVAGHRRAFGSDTVPGCYDDLDQADLIVLVGSNTAWCHPVLFQRIQNNGRERGAKVVVIDPRRTATGEEADLFLAIRPGADTALFCGLLTFLSQHSALDQDFIDAHTSGFGEALARANDIAGGIAATAAATGLAEQDVVAFFELFRATPRVVTCFSQGVNQSAQGADKVNAIINCHLATGRIGKVGAGPLSLTGQPNAMGGREVGGLANQLAAHMDFSPENIARVRRFWRAPHMATHEGLKAVQMFDAIAQGRVRALWVMGTNPAVSLPDADRARAALSRLDLFVVSENVLSNDTVNSGAQVVLPALAWGEKSGTVTNSERRISRQRAFRPAPGEARPDWWIVSEVARRLGFGAAFAYRSAADIFREHAQLSGFENAGARAFDMSGLSHLSDAAYDELPPVTWPIRLGETAGPSRIFADGRFFTSDQRARFIAPEPPALASATSPRRPLQLNTGRVRDQWHTMTRTGASPRLGQHLPQPFVEVHPDDAANHGLADGGFARVSTDYGDCVLKVVATERQQRGTVFAPIHWSDATASFARIGSLVAPFVDPISGQPEMKATPASLSPASFAHCGFVLSRKPLALPADCWWSHVAVKAGHGYLIADNLSSGTWRRWFDAQAQTDDVAVYEDTVNGVYRAASFDGGNIALCVFVDPFDTAPSWDATRALFEAPALGVDQRRIVLSGKSDGGEAGEGPIVCACFGVGCRTIDKAIVDGARTTAEIGKQLKAGTNCGSCVPEIRRMVAQAAAESAEPRKQQRESALV